MSGKFIVFEGINGSGKTTIINNLINYYNKHNIKYKYIKFPNRTTKSGIIIDKFLKKQYEFNSIQEQIKIFADNRKEYEFEIKNYLNDGNIILCDRYLYSNLAYILTDISLDLQFNKYFNYPIMSINDILQYDNGLLKPDFVFLINGDHINLRNDNIKERYHNNSIKNTLIFNNYLISLNYTNSKYYIVNNILGRLQNTTDIIIKQINCISNTGRFEHF
jgi:dTMP kinase